MPKSLRYGRISYEKRSNNGHGLVAELYVSGISSSFNQLDEGHRTNPTSYSARRLAEHELHYVQSYPRRVESAGVDDTHPESKVSDRGIILDVPNLYQTLLDLFRPLRLNIVEFDDGGSADRATHTLKWGRWLVSTASMPFRGSINVAEVVWVSLHLIQGIGLVTARFEYQSRV